MKPKVLKSSQVCATAMGVQCRCGGDCYESSYGSAWINEWDGVTTYNFKCEECNQVWVFPTNINIVVKFNSMNLL